MRESCSAVFDCNVFLQAMLSTNGASYACWQKTVTGEIRLFVTPYILAEIRKLSDHKKLKRYRSFTPERVERFIEEILDTAELIPDPPAKFNYSRDPDDSHYVDVAVSTDSMLIVSNDKDLLDLMSDANSDGKMLRAAHPSFRVFTPAQLLHVIAKSPRA